MAHRMLYGHAGLVPEDLYETTFGMARTLAAGDDLTIVGISHMVLERLRAQHALATVGISAEVIDPISLAPLDIDTIVGSVERTGRLLVVDNGWVHCRAAAEIAIQGH